MLSLFLSHSEKDKAFARRLKERLRENSIEVWNYEGNLKPGDSLPQEICSAIERSDYFIVVLSPDSVSSPWVQKEINVACICEIEDGKPKIIPILLEKCKRPACIREKRYLDIAIDFTDRINFDGSFSELVKIIGNSKSLAITPNSPPEDSVTLEQDTIDGKRICSKCRRVLEWYFDGWRCSKCNPAKCEKHDMPMMLHKLSDQWICPNCKKCEKCGHDLVYDVIGKSEGLEGYYKDDYEWVCPAGCDWPPNFGYHSTQDTNDKAKRDAGEVKCAWCGKQKPHSAYHHRDVYGKPICDDCDCNAE